MSGETESYKDFDVSKDKIVEGDHMNDTPQNNKNGFVGWAGIVAYDRGYIHQGKKYILKDKERVDIVRELHSEDRILAVYPTKEIAKNLYECVEKVRITIEEV